MLAISVIKVYPQSQISCQDYGTAVYCSNGLSAIRAGGTMYFSDGTTASTYGNTTYIQEQPVQVTRSDDYYQAGQALGSLVLGIVGVVQDIRRLGKWEDYCFVNPYARGWVNGSPAFCSKDAILDACSNIPSFDFSGYKNSWDSPHHIGWAGDDLIYWPSWPKKGVYDEIKCVPDVAGHAIHEAKLWLFYKQEASFYLPGLSQDDCIRIVNYIYAHPKEYKYIKEDDPNT